MKRRGFLTGAAACACALLAGPGPSRADKGNLFERRAQLLKGVFDLHVQADPNPRLHGVSDMTVATQARDAGLTGLLFTAGEAGSYAGAAAIRKNLPGFTVCGSLVMNRRLGNRVNPQAAADAVRNPDLLCRGIWMPTLDSAWQCWQEKRGEGIPVLGETGHVLPEVVRVMEICAEADIIFATGHSHPEESLILARKAREIGVRKCVVSNVNVSLCAMSREQIRLASELGAYPEYCCLPCFWDFRTKSPRNDRKAKKEASTLAFRCSTLSPERSFLSSGLGFAGAASPLEAMQQVMYECLWMGISDEKLDRMCKTIPAWLAGLDKEGESV